MAFVEEYRYECIKTHGEALSGGEEDREVGEGRLIHGPHGSEVLQPDCEGAVRNAALVLVYLSIFMLAAVAGVVLGDAIILIVNMVG